MLVQIFTETEKLENGKYRLRFHHLTELDDCGTTRIDWKASDNLEAQTLAVGFAIRDIVEGDQKLGMFATGRTAIVYCPNLVLVEYIKFRPLRGDHLYLSKYINRINTLRTRNGVLVSLGRIEEVVPSTKEFWANIYGVKKYATKQEQ